MNQKEKELLDKIDKANLPAHVAIIMDGNGRWAKKKKLPRVFGHKAGIETVKKITRACSDIGIKCLSLYAFSTENWLRPQTEVQFLMKLIQIYLRKETVELIKSNVKLITTGDTAKLPKLVQETIDYTKKVTENCDKMSLNLCLNYGGRQEIISAANRLLKSKLDNVTEESFAEFLMTKEIPDPDLMIRTSGEIRLSNFMLWQMAYSEFYFTDVLWPDFDKTDFYGAIIDFQGRQRRYGKI